MELPNQSNIDRLKAIVGAVILEALLLYALVAGLRVSVPAAITEELKVFTIAQEQPPPRVKVVPAPTNREKPEGAASPPNLKSRASEIVVPAAAVVIAPPPPVVAAPAPDLGSQASSGAANVIGPGTGSGGQGNGNGSGEGGNGTGNGNGNGTAPRWIKGRLKDSDYPREAGRAGVGGTVEVRYAVEVDGRVTDCIVTRSSGNAQLDETTCRLLEKRYRYRPARDAHGRPVRSLVVESHSWIIEEDPSNQASPD